MNVDKQRVRALNDDLRRYHRGGKIVLTPSVLALDEQAIRKIDVAIASFTSFDDDNDPHGEHDFGSVTVAGKIVIFKIDYYDLDLHSHSPDPSDATVTQRVMTIMLADEY